MALIVAGAVLILLLLLKGGPADPPDRESNSVLPLPSPNEIADVKDGDDEVAPALSQEAQASANHKAPPILVEVDEITKANLEPWFEKYLAENESPEPVTEYGFFVFDDVVVQNIVSGAIAKIHFHLNNRHSYEVEFVASTMGKGVTLLGGDLLDYPNGSRASIFVWDDGTVSGGSVRAMGCGLLIIRSIPGTPYHVVFARTGTLPFH